MEENSDKIKLPKGFEEECKEVIGAEWNEFVAALSSDAVVSIRYNDKKCLFTETDIEKVLNVKDKMVPWCMQGRYLEERPKFTLDPMFHAGAYYVQEASSMFIAQALEQYVGKDSLALDLCAAPGGKSTLISSYLSEKGMLVSNEYVPQRAHILVENMTKWGVPNSVVTNNSPVHFEKFKNIFDVVAVDAPCSGEGMFRKDANAIQEWSLENVDKCVVRQREILESAWKTLKPGGILIYSTCTYNKRENEEQIKWLIEEKEAEYKTLNIDKQWLVTETEYGYRFLPHKTKGEGLFLAVVGKRDGECGNNKYKLPKKLPEKNEKLLSFIEDREKYTTLLYKNIFYAVQKERYNLMIQLLETLNVMNFGIPIAEIKGKSEIPQAGLALSLKYKRNAMPEVDVDYEKAIAFLRTEAISLEDTPKGYVLITYKNIPLGWVKNIGNRCNNLYPEHWRIRMQLKK